MPSRGSAAGQQAQRPHQVFPARRATCQQTALKKVGSKREAGQRPPRVTQPPVVQEGVHVDGDREIRAALEHTLDNFLHLGLGVVIGAAGWYLHARPHLQPER